MVRFFDPGKGYRKLKPEMDEAIERVLSGGDLILRKDTEDFEKSLADFIGVKYAVGLNSCTDALYLALRAYGIGKGDEVLVPSRTFAASASVISQVGAYPVFMDLDGYFEVNPRTKAIIPVHIEGFLGNKDMKSFYNFCTQQGVKVIEDAAQAFGASQDGQMAGSFGDVGCFSFYPAKILGAYGDAGALVTNNEDVYKYVRDCRNHFKEDARDWGVNSRLDNLQAAILNVKMKYIADTLLRRWQVANIYQAELKDLPMTLPLHIPGRVWQDYIIQLDSKEQRDSLHQFLILKNVETLKNNYPFPVTKRNKAQAYEDETLRIPCNELLEESEVHEVIKAIKSFYE